VTTRRVAGKQVHDIRSKFRRLITRCLRPTGYTLVPVRVAEALSAPHLRPTEASDVEVLQDPEFQHSCEQVMQFTLLDPPRLANLWTLARLSKPEGNIIEVGVYRGGSALHLANSCPDRLVFACDSFEGFRTLDPALDHLFRSDMFKDTSVPAVEQLFRSSGRSITIVPGYFPDSCVGVSLDPLSFAHLDVDTYDSTSAALAFIAPKMLDHSLILLDDYQRNAQGVDKAVAAFVGTHRDWCALPIFPSQGLLIHRSWFA
jgi:O-methyltransferase